MSALPPIGERMKSLNQTAQDGDMDAFFRLIRKDPHILEEIDAIPFVDTPLHVTASGEGSEHIHFAMEIVRLKPSFARKPNPDGYSPIHLALQKERTEMVRRLLQVDPDLVRVKGRGGRTPLHVVAESKQLLDLLGDFLLCCPNSIEDVTIQNQTAVHIALENNNLEAFKRLVSCLHKYESEKAREILNRSDEKDITVLSVAVSKGQTEAVRELLNFGVNRKLKQGEENNSVIIDMLRYDGVLSCSRSFLPKVICYENWLRNPIGFVDGRSQFVRKTVLFFDRVFVRLRLLSQIACEGSRISNDERNVLLVVAALLISITYQAATTPPGGLYQSDEYSNSIPTAPATGPAPGPAPVLLEIAGTSIGQSTFRNFGIIATLNYFTFTLSAVMTGLLLPRGYISALFRMALVQLWVSYYYSLTVIILSLSVFHYCLISTGLCLLLVLIAFFGRQFCGATIKRLRLDWIFYMVYACIMFLIALVFVKGRYSEI